MSLPEAASQSLSVLSLLADSTFRLSGENATEVTASAWPSKLLRSWPVPASQSLSVLSAPPASASLPSEESATESTSSECPSKLLRIWPVAVSQSLTVLSLAARERLLAIGHKRGGRHLARMPVDSDALSRCHIPDTQARIVAARQDAPAIGRERHRIGAAGLRVEGPQQEAGRHVPQPQEIVLAGGHCLAAIRRKRHRVHGFGEAEDEFGHRIALCPQLRKRETGHKQYQRPQPQGGTEAA